MSAPRGRGNALDPGGPGRLQGRRRARRLDALCEYDSPGGGPPPHVHYLQEEAHYVLEGTFSFLNGNEWIEAQTGSFIWIPRGVRHTFRNVGSQTGRLFSTNTLPGAHERWFRHVGVPMTDRASFQPPEGLPDMKDVLTSAAREDIHLEMPDHA